MVLTDIAGDLSVKISVLILVVHPTVRRSIEIDDRRVGRIARRRIDLVNVEQEVAAAGEERSKHDERELHQPCSPNQRSSRVAHSKSCCVIAFLSCV